MRDGGARSHLPCLTCQGPARSGPRTPRAPGGQASPHLTLGPVILPPEQGLAPTVFLKALPIPLYHTVPPGGLQPRAPLGTGGLEGGSLPFLLSPLLQPEGPGPAHVGKPATPTLTVNIVGALPVLSPGPGPPPGGPGKARHAGKYLCPHCGRDCLKPSVLEKHIRSHTGERPFPCATCGIAFKTQSNLYKHRRTQTHLSSSRLSSESQGQGGSVPEEAGEAAAGQGGSRSPGGGGGAPPERPLSPGAQGAGRCPATPTHRPAGAETLDLQLEAACRPRPTSAGAETGAASAPARRPLPEHRTPVSSEKPWEAKAAEGRLRKCESTDSGYLSRSDSVEQPPAPGSPLHSLSERSAEAEGEGAPGPGGARAEPGGRGPSLALEKRQLEERIARLISHNQAVVDDPQLDHVRPRKTVLCKQGSIDLPVPYTYKDSFHFEIRAPEPGRRRPGALGPARSTCSPLGRARPLFFHSVPTQLSTSAECVPVTRSNSLPFVEGTRTWQEPPDPQDPCSRRQKPLSPRSAPARWVDVPSGHPRALVRQAAVEDLPCPSSRDTATPTEDPAAKRAGAGDAAVAAEGRAAGRTRSQRRLKMFSQEKWQVYGRETFQRLYQKMRPGRQRGRTEGEGSGPAQDHPLQDRTTPVCGDTSVGAPPGPLGSPPATEGFLVTESPKQRERPGVSRSVSPPTLSCGETPCLGSKSPVLPPHGRLELGCPPPPAPGPLKGGDLEAPPLALPDPQLEGGPPGGGDTKEPCLQALAFPRRPGSSSGEPQPAGPQPAGPQLPSERKKLRVEVPSRLEPPGPLDAGGQTAGHPGQAASVLSWDRDSPPGDKAAGLHRGAECPVVGRAGALEVSGASSCASLVAPGLEGLGDKESGLGPAAAISGDHSLQGSQPRAPTVPKALTDTTFPPRYLLRLPQGEAPSPSPGAQGPLCRGRGPGNSASSAGPGGEAGGPTGLASGGAHHLREDPSWSRRGVPREGEGGSNTPAAGESPREMASVLLPWVCDPHRSKTRDAAGHLCTGRTWAGAWPSGGAQNPWPLNRGTGEPPGNVPEGPPPGAPAGHTPCVSLRPPGWPGPASGAHSDSPGGRFPSLRAEPQLTWCYLSSSLPLPLEQKDRAKSVCWALHRADQGTDATPVSKAASGRWTGTSPAGGGETPLWKVSCPAASEVTSGPPGSEPAWRKGPAQRRAKLSHQRSQQKTRRRCRGSFLPGRVQLRAQRLCRPHRALRKDCHPPPPEKLHPRRTLGQAASEMAGLSLQEESRGAGPAPSPGCGNGEQEAEDRRPATGGVSPSPSPREPHELTAQLSQDVIEPVGEHSDPCPRSPAGTGLSPPPDSCVPVAGNHRLSCSKGPDRGFPETPRLHSREQVSRDSKPSDAQEPSSLEPTGHPVCPGVATSAADVPTPPEARGGHTALGPQGAGPQEHGPAAGDMLTHRSPDRKAAVRGASPAPAPSPALLLGTPSPARRLSGSVPWQPPGKTHLEMPASGPGPTNLHKEGGRPERLLPAGGPQGCGETLVSFAPFGQDGEKHQESGFVAPSQPGQPTEVPPGPPKTIKKRGLEGVRKQSCVEFSEGSSDDEDRLVIEI